MLVIENIENIVSLLCTIVGLLYCTFQYIDTPRRGFRFLIAFFLANFLSEYYWTCYELITKSYPEVSAFVAYLGWNVGYLCLLFAVYFIRHEKAKRFFHPLILLPVALNVPQFFLYIRYGGFLNNLWEVGVTTVTMVFCMQALVQYWKNRDDRKDFPYFSLVALLYLLAEYGMWTSSCFSWSRDELNPYHVLSFCASVLRPLLVFAAARHYKRETDAAKPKSAAELRFQVIIQTVMCFLIVGICAAGYYIASHIQNEGQIVTILFAVSTVLIFLLLGLLYVLTSRYRSILEIDEKADMGMHSRRNLIMTIAVTLALMIIAGVYNSTTLYNASVVSVYEDGVKEIKSTATELESYLTVASTTLRVVADGVDYMVKDGRSSEELAQFIVDQTKRQAEQFDENFTGLYAYINGEYLDGLGWVPPEGYEPTERDWYRSAVKAGGEIVIVSPYVDAQTGSVVITIGKSVSDAERDSANVVCLDVIVNHIQEVTEKMEIAGKGYGLVVNTDGFIIAHRDAALNGKNLADVYGQELLDAILNTEGNRTTASINGEDCTLFIAPVMGQWHAVIVIGNSELFEGIWSQLIINIMVLFSTFCLITFFYYIGYKNEQISGKRVEEMNLQVVSALAAAIDAKDNYTNGHSSRVAEYARTIAARSGCSPEEQNEIYMMGLLHDVGKIGVPDEVINKPSRLTEDEFELIKRHPVIGSNILASIKQRPKLATGARWHHERYGGGGYPDNIAGEQIPEEARIIAVADAYDAMTSRRSYREIMPQEKVLQELKKGSGTQFDPRFAKIMIEMIEEDHDYSMREK